MKISKLRSHFNAIAKQHGIKVRRYYDRFGLLGGAAFRDDLVVYTPKIRSTRSYIISMHELGHCLGPWQKSTVLIREAGAWKWARENSLVWNKSAMRTMHQGALSYYVSAMEEQLMGLKKALAFPKSGHYFWQCTPELRERPAWLSEGLHVVPWQKVMADSQRPRCSTCRNWEPHHKDEKGSEWGTCASPKEPMGVRPMVPEEALCGRDYLPNL